MRLDRDAGRAKRPRVAELVRRSLSGRSRRPPPGKSRAALPESARRPSSRARPTPPRRRRIPRRARRGTASSSCRSSRAGRRLRWPRSPARAASASRSRPADLRGCRRGSDRAARPGAVKAVLVVARRDRLGDLALDLDADVIGRHQIASGDGARFAQRQRGRKDRRGRMRQQAIHPVLRRRRVGCRRNRRRESRCRSRMRRSAEAL